MTDPTMLPAVDLVRLYRQRRLSPVEVVQACLGKALRSARFDAFALLDAEGALAAARESEARWQAVRPLGLLDGVPATVKDLLLWEGHPTRRGSRTTGDPAPDRETAPSVLRLLEHGAVILGKTTTPEFGWKGVTDNPLGEVARNPFDRTRTAGGSSGGAAVAAALGLGAIHLGTDGGGSIRIPAGFCGVVGLKASFGRVPAWPISPFGSVAHIGPLTRTVADAALALTVLAEPDARDWTALPDNAEDYRADLGRSLQGLTIAASLDFGLPIPVEPAVAAAFEASLIELADRGATVERVDPPVGDGAALFATLWFSAAAHLLRSLTPAQRAMVDPGLVAVADLGGRVTAAELYAAEAARRQLGSAMQRFFERVDLLVTPTLPLTAFPAGQLCPVMADGASWVDWTPFTWPFNLTQQPAVTIPNGQDAAGLPTGLQVVGPKYADALVLQVAHALEQPFRPAPSPG